MENAWENEPNSLYNTAHKWGALSNLAEMTRKLSFTLSNYKHDAYTVLLVLKSGCW